MIHVNLTTFLDIASKAGAPKITAVRHLKQRGEYNPAHDFWRPLRRAMVQAHRTGDISALDGLMPTVTDKKKLSNYPARIRAHRNWWERNDYEWLTPPRGEWEHAGVSIRVNPELGLQDDAERIATKLYFKQERPSKLRVDVILHLLETTVMPSGEGGGVAIPDVPRGNLLRPTVSKPGMEAALRGEAGYIAAAWDEA